MLFLTAAASGVTKMQIVSAAAFNKKQALHSPKGKPKQLNS